MAKIVKLGSFIQFDEKSANPITETKFITAETKVSFFDLRGNQLLEPTLYTDITKDTDVPVVDKADFLAYIANFNLGDGVEFLFIDNSLSPYTIPANFQKGFLSVDATDGDIEIITPDIDRNRRDYQIVYYEGQNDILVRTENNQPIGDALFQRISEEGTAIRIISQQESGSDEYLVRQDSRGKRDNIVPIRKASDFTANLPLSGSVIYEIQGVVDVSGLEIELTENLNLNGYGFGVSKLISNSDNQTLFSNAAGNDGGDIVINGLSFELSGVNSKVFNVNNRQSGGGGNSAIEMNIVNFENCSNPSTFLGYRQLLISGSGWLFCNGGIELGGEMTGGARISTSIFIAPTGGTNVKGLVGLTIATRYLSDVNMQVPVGVVGYDFTESMFLQDAGLQLIDGNIVGDGLRLQGIDATSRKAKIRSIGLSDTYAGSKWTLTTEAVTTITTAGVFVKMEGVTTYSQEYWFTNIADNSIICNNDQDGLYDIFADGSVTSNNNNQIGIQIVKITPDGVNPDIITILRENSITTNGTGRVESIAIQASDFLNENERIEIWVANKSGTGNITGKIGFQTTVLKRAIT